MEDLYGFMQESVASSFDRMALIKTSERGSICRIRHKESHNLYILREQTGSAAAYQRLRGLHCPALPHIYEAAQREDYFLELEEFIPGDTLSELLTCGPLPGKIARHIAKQLCEALYVLHSLGLVHRDVKPDNVMIWGDRVVLIDLDSTRERDPHKQQDTRVLGTAGYAPPEQYGISQTDERADIYAMGVLINEMLTLEHPSVRLAKGHWGRLVARCTMINPRQRYTSALALRDAL